MKTTPQQNPANSAARMDAIVIVLERMQALAALFSNEESTSRFADLNISQQVAIFGLFEDALSDVLAALTNAPAKDARE
ncbi:hypothetical protein BYI23_B010940 [Burkholderia sp. YI23]|nr:hypothetical protein BYI23_B010940 [Burkholderia sp. YI23]